ncbi:MAG: D-alanine--D-alanine ligase, partial [Verrucomicrobiota bacterium]
MIGQRKIGVLMGGLSAERDISIRSGEAVVAALADRGYDAWPLFVDRDVDLVLRQARIDVAFVALHGRYGEDGCIQGVLELLGIPYTGSGVLASALAMNKVRAKEVFRLNNLPTAPGYVVQSDGGEDLLELHGSFGFPVIVKPAGEGSSLGIKIARDELELEAAVEEALRYDDDVLVERFIEGKEVSVAILDGKPVGAV